MLEFPKAPFFVLNFSYYTLMTFLIILSVILLSMLMILLSNLRVIRHLNLWQQLELTFEPESDLWDTVDRERKWIVDSSAEKTQLVSFDRYITLVLLMWKLIDLFLRQNHLLIKMLRLPFSSKFDWGSYIISIAKTAGEKNGALIPSMKILSHSFL